MGWSELLLVLDCYLVGWQFVQRLLHGGLVGCGASVRATFAAMRSGKLTSWTRAGSIPAECLVQVHSLPDAARRALTASDATQLTLFAVWPGWLVD